MYHYGRRYYSPELGRWINRDPIGERGGTHLYAYAKNQALLLFDLLGMWVGPIRNGESRAILYAECEDKISDLDEIPELAAEVGFDIREYEKWLKPEDGLELPGLDEEIRRTRVFSIPNKVYIGYGRLTRLEWIFWRFSLDSHFNQATREFEDQGFSVVRDFGLSYSEVSQALADENIYGLSYWGHGWDLHLLPAGAPVVEDGDGILGPYYARGMLHHGLPLLTLQSCASLAYVQNGMNYRDLVTRNGKIGGHFQNVPVPHVWDVVILSGGTYTPSP